MLETADGVGVPHGHLVRDLTLYGYEGPPLARGALVGIAKLLNAVPRVRSLDLDGLPGISVANNAVSDVVEFQSALKGLANLHSLSLASSTMVNTYSWISIILSALPENVARLRLDSLTINQSRVGFPPEFPIVIEDAVYCTSLKELYFWGEDSTICAQAICRLIALSPHLEEVQVEGEISDTVLRALLGAGPGRRRLSLNTDDLPHLPECRINLQRHFNLLAVEVSGADFLYYLPFLPPSVQSITFKISLGFPETSMLLPVLEGIERQVRECFASSAWCPQLEDACFTLFVKKSHALLASDLDQRAKGIEAELQNLALSHHGHSSFGPWIQWYYSQATDVETFAEEEDESSSSDSSDEEVSGEESSDEQGSEDDESLEGNSDGNESYEEDSDKEILEGTRT